MTRTSLNTSGGWFTGFAWRRVQGRIEEAGARFQTLGDSELRRRSLALRYRAQSGEAGETLSPEAFALARIACERVLEMRHFDVQLLGGMAMCRRAVAEMQTGEGKTLTAVLPVYTAALRGEGVHVATANDYLATRDARFLRPAYELLGLSVGEIDSTTPRPQRAQAYRCDITYSTAREFGFDFLRDRLASSLPREGRPDFWTRLMGRASDDWKCIQRKLDFILVDEADSLLIDEARTPLIIAANAAPLEVTQAAYRWAASVCVQFTLGEHFENDAEHHQVNLTGAGRRQVRELARPSELDELPLFDLYEYVERALRAARDFHRDHQYLVRDGQIVIVDEFTGRLADGRKWRDGLHQAIEAKEGLPISVATGELARVSVQNFFRQYRRLAGMTGTAGPARRELRRIYGLDVVTVPTHRPCRRLVWSDSVWGSSEQRWAAVVAETQKLSGAGRPVLIGTRSIDRSERLASLLQEAGLEPHVLNARHPAREAEIVAAAGEPGRVTVATNMAGRGTDISISDDVAAHGGLHVIGTELHESARVDRQLMGRCARQGDPGSFRQFMALDDDIVESGLGPKVANYLKRIGLQSTTERSRFARLIRHAQRCVERQQYRQRRLLLYSEQENLERQRELGQDPYLDAAY